MIVWADGIAVCHRCVGTSTYELKNLKPLLQRCRDCCKHFSIRHGTILEDSHIPLRKWAIAIYLVATSLKGMSSMKLYQDLGITQKTAWFMLHRFRKALPNGNDLMKGIIEVDETYMADWNRISTKTRN